MSIFDVVGTIGVAGIFYFGVRSMFQAAFLEVVVFAEIGN
jgi:hypothetical protein